MPIMDGFTASRSIRDLERSYKMHRSFIVILSANTYPEEEINKIEYVDLSLEKPVSPIKIRELFEALEMVKD